MEKQYIDHETKVKYLTHALNLGGISVNDQVVDHVITAYEKILIKGGKFSLRDAVDIQCAIEYKYKEKEVQARREKMQEAQKMKKEIEAATEAIAPMYKKKKK